LGSEILLQLLVGTKKDDFSQGKTEMGLSLLQDLPTLGKVLH